MKKTMKKVVFLISLLFCQTSFAIHEKSGLFFNLATTSSTLNITTTIPNHSYPNAGIKVNTSGFSIQSGCTANANGYCLFPVSDTSSATISMTGPVGGVQVTLCLNGLGPLSCQQYAVSRRSSQIFVGDVATNYVLTFPADGNGNISPIYNLSGSNTGNNVPYDLYLDSSNHLWVSNWSNASSGSVTQFLLPANGNVFPQVKIAGVNTTFRGPSGVGKDAIGNIYVADYDSNAINIFAPGSIGNVAPIRRIFGNVTMLDSPQSIIITPLGNIYVTNAGGSGNILEFAAGADGNVPPIRIITSEFILVLTGLWIDMSGNIWVTDNFYNSIVEFSSNANGDSTPIRTITGPNTNIIGAYGLSIDAQGYIYEVGTGFPGINVFSPTANGNVAPVQVITGPNTLLSSPAGLSVN